jgi:hypothetical protein
MVLMYMTVNVLAVSIVVVYHAARAKRLRPFEKPAGRRAGPSAPQEAVTTAEWGDYVRLGLEDLAVMLAQAARKRPY